MRPVRERSRRERAGFLPALSPLAVLAALLAGPGIPRADPQLADRIVAVVGDEIILLSEVDEEVYLGRLRGAVELEDSTAIREYRESVLEAMIEEKILFEKARAEGIRVSREEIDGAVEGMIDDIRARFPGDESFQAQLSREGMTLDALRANYRDKVEEQLMVRQVMDRLIRSRVKVEEREIRDYWDENRAEIPPIPAGLELRRILVSLRSEAAIDSAAIERAGIVLRRVRDGEDFATLASVFSEGPTAARGGDLGWFDPGDLEPALADAVEGLPPGEVTPVVVTRRGAHILRVEERRDSEVRLRQIVFLADQEAARASARARAEAILRRVRQGESFAAVATTESDDPATRDSGGYLGKVPVEALSPVYRSKLENLAPGDVSEILEDEEGFSIFRVEGKEGERPATFDELHDRIATLLEQQQAQGLYREFIEKARAETYVEKRLFPES